MSMRIVIGVNRRVPIVDNEADIEVCLFEGEMLADQYIDALYKAEWTAMQNAGTHGGSTLDRWANDDRFSDYPLFYKTQHELWSNVPPNVFRVAGHFDTPGVVHPLVPGSKVGAPETVFHDTRGADTELTVERVDPRFEAPLP